MDASQAGSGKHFPSTRRVVATQHGGRGGRFPPIVPAAASLDEESHASLASQLLRSLAPARQAVTDEEVAERMREAEADPGVMLRHGEFLSGIVRR